jgi:transposase
MSTTKQRRSSKERFWRRMVRQWRSSGLSIRDFCDDRDISEPSFYAWRRIIAQRDAEPAAFVPVQVVAEAKQTEPSSQLAGSGLELILGAGRVLRVGPGFDGPTLRRLLALLEEGQP